MYVCALSMCMCTYACVCVCVCACMCEWSIALPGSQVYYSNTTIKVQVSTHVIYTSTVVP